MNSDQIASIVEGIIPLLGGIYAILMSYRKKNQSTEMLTQFDSFIHNNRGSLRVLGYLMCLMSVFMVAKAFYA